MQIQELITPSFLVELDCLEANIKKMAAIAQGNGVELWPMIKTHKSVAITKLQQEYGAAGFLTGTIDEAEGLVRQGFRDLMLAYPVAGRENTARVAALAGQARLVIGLDGVAAAAELDAALAAAGTRLDYLVIVDCGLGRFGVAPEKTADLVEALSDFKTMNFKGISSHPGHVYAATGPSEVAPVARDEIRVLAAAREILMSRGLAVTVIATGSTPTACYEAESGVVTVLRPGNYVFLDNLQIALGQATEADCSLTVLATVIAQPRSDSLIVDAGSKCLGLDQGAHGIKLMAGHGRVVDHPELIVTALSEEVGKIHIESPTTVRVGDKIRIIPNHACSAANMTDYLIGYRRGVVEKTITIDFRGGTRQRPV